MADSIVDNIWNLIEGKFSGVRQPASSAEVQALISPPASVQGIISLLDDNENLDIYRSINIPYLHLAVKGGTSPTPTQVQEAISFQESLNGLVVVHCTNGRRRTGTLLGAIYIQLMKNNMHGVLLFDNMKAQLLASKPDCDLREGQWEYLKALALLSE
jgi:hypothetical protein